MWINNIHSVKVVTTLVIKKNDSGNGGGGAVRYLYWIFTNINKKKFIYIY